MKILLTGSSGRVGRAVAAELVSNGHSVTGFDSNPPTNPIAGVTYIQGSLADYSVVMNLCMEGKFDQVAHLGALMSWNDADIQKMYDSNVTGTFNILESCKLSGTKKFIFVSSGETYPEGNAAYLPVDEQHPQKPMSFYGETKLIGEKLLEFYGRKYGFLYKILRISHTQDAEELLDPDSFFSGARFFLKAKIARGKLLGKHAEVSLLEKLYDGKEKLVISRGEDGTPFMMHISETRDTAHGIVLALQSDAGIGEAFNIGNDDPIEFDKAIPLMAGMIGLPVVDVCLPGKAVHYRTSNQKAKKYFEFKPQWDLIRMLSEAAKAYAKIHPN
jgi:UDP-glucose 4-epimerase